MYFWKNVNGGEERRDATKERKEKGSPGGCYNIEEKNKFEVNKEKRFWKGKGKESMGKNKVREKVFLTKAYRLLLFFIGDIIIIIAEN